MPSGGGPSAGEPKPRAPPPSAPATLPRVAEPRTSLRARRGCAIVRRRRPRARRSSSAVPARRRREGPRPIVHGSHRGRSENRDINGSAQLGACAERPPLKPRQPTGFSTHASVPTGRPGGSEAGDDWEADEAEPVRPRRVHPHRVVLPPMASGSCPGGGRAASGGAFRRSEPEDEESARAPVTAILHLDAVDSRRW